MPVIAPPSCFIGNTTDGSMLLSSKYTRPFSKSTRAILTSALGSTARPLCADASGAVPVLAPSGLSGKSAEKLVSPLSLILNCPYGSMTVSVSMVTVGCAKAARMGPERMLFQPINSALRSGSVASKLSTSTVPLKWPILVSPVSTSSPLTVSAPLLSCRLMNWLT